jgi:hypothetical protein
MPRYRYSARYGHKLMPSATITHRLPGVWRIIYHTNEHGFRTGMPPSRMYMIDQILSLSVTRIPLVWESLTVINSARCSTKPLEQKQALSTWACLVEGSQARYGHTMSLVAFSTRGCSLMTTILTTICISAVDRTDRCVYLFDSPSNTPTCFRFLHN